MKRYLHDVILWILLGCLMIVMMVAFLSADFGFIGFLEQRHWIWAVVVLGLIVSLYILSSYYATRWIEEIFDSYLESDLRYLIFPLSFPLILMIILGFGIPNYLSFACAAITGLFMVRSYHWLQKKRSVTEFHLLRYQLFVRYVIYFVFISFFFYMSLNF